MITFPVPLSKNPTSPVAELAFKNTAVPFVWAIAVVLTARVKPLKVFVVLSLFVYFNTSLFICMYMYCIL